MLGWNDIIERSLTEEGGYAFDPQDPGGETNWGITKRVAMQNGFLADMKNMTRDTAIGIYYQEYWKKIRLCDVNSVLAFQVFDFGINHGPQNSIRILQDILKVQADGVIGDQTMAAISGWNIESLVMAFIAGRQKYYLNNPDYKTYGKGWLGRCSDCLLWASQDLRRGLPLSSSRS